MVFDVDVGAVFGIIVAVGGAFWALLKLMFIQYDKRQEERFAALTVTMGAQKEELDEHMKKQDTAMAEIRRVENLAVGEIRRVENELTRCQLDNVQRFQTKTEATNQYSEILGAIRALSTRIDQIIAAPKGGQ